MTREKVLEWAKSIHPNQNEYFASGFMAEIKEMIKSYIGKNNSFYSELESITPEWIPSDAMDAADVTLKRFISVVERDLISGISLNRKIQTDVVSDILEQAQEILNDEKFHPASSAILIGAGLEEFLRNWVEDSNIDISGHKLSIDTYAKALKDKELIDKQDSKDIISWAGIRNDAAHGHWDNLNDRKRILLMIEGVTYFIRRKSNQ